MDQISEQAREISSESHDPIILTDLAAIKYPLRRAPFWSPWGTGPQSCLFTCAARQLHLNVLKKA
jgi:hypothetical protein